jgi:WD40 repeat protein
VGPLLREVEKPDEEREVSVLFYNLVTKNKRWVVLDAPRDWNSLSRYQLSAVARRGGAIATLRFGEKEVLLEVWNTATGKVTTRAARKDNSGGELARLVLELSDDGKQLAVITAKSEIELWDVTTGIKSRTLVIPPEALKKYGSPGSDPMHSMAFSPDGTQLAVSLGHCGIAIYSLKQ